MFTVTPAALKRLGQMLAKQNPADDMALRFSRTAGRWRLDMDRARPDDATFTHDGRKVLLLDEAAATAAAAMAMRLKSTDAGPRFKMHKTHGTED